VRSKLLCVVLAAIMILSGTVIPLLADTTTDVDTTSRIVGQDYYQTSVAIAEAYNNNGDCGNVILASGDSFPDALSASILSKKLNAPILLVGTTVNASSDAFNYISTNVSNTGTVYIMGGTGVIGPDFETKLTSMGYSNIKRLGGTDRYDTNMLIANDVNVPQGTSVFIASGENFPDALSIASFSGSRQYPTLLVGADYLPEQTKNYLLNEKPSTVYITGGTSVVSQDLESQIKVLFPGATITRLAGDDRYGTNAAVLNEFSPTPATIYLANGDDFQDVLAGSALAAKKGDPIILVDNQRSTLPPAVNDYLKKLSGSAIQPNVIALGGTDVVSDNLIQQVSDVFSTASNNSTSPGATVTDNNALIEKQQKAGLSRIVVGNGTAYYVDSVGHVWAWGAGANGELGNGTMGIQLSASDSTNPIYGSNVPVEVSNLSNIVSIAAGGNTCYALDNGGHVWAWGDGTYGQLGNGTKATQLSNGQYPIFGSNIPVQVSNLTNIISIAAGDSTGYALDSSGNVWTWGDGGGGQLGIPNGQYTSDIPIQIPTLTDIVSISAEAQGGEAFAFDSSGQVWAWGPFGSSIHSGLGWASGLTTDSQAFVPVQLSNLTNIVAFAYEGFGPKAILHDAFGNGWSFQTSDQLWYVLDNSGQVWAWEFAGSNVTYGTRITPIKVSNLSKIVAIVGMRYDNNSGYAMDSSGNVWTWGDAKSFDEVGKDGTINQSTPVQVSNISNIVEITGNDTNCYAFDRSGQVWAWGLSNNGQLGNGTTTDSSVPVQVIGLPK